MICRQYAWLLVVAAAFLAGLAPTSATTLSPVGPRQLVQDAELIFEGVVTAVEYRLSDVATPDHIALPHTFVTFAIERTFKGAAAEGSAITLRFRGGPTGRDSVLLTPGIPLFEVGDRDFLFVRGNGADFCPLVGWEQGRFRVIEDLVYTNHGQEVWLTRRGELAVGPHHAFPEVVTRHVAGFPLRFETRSPQAAWAPPSGAQRLGAAGFRAFLAGRVTQAYTPHQLAGLPPVPSTDIADAFYVTAPRPGAPPSVPAIAEQPNPEEEPEPAAEPPAIKHP